MSVTISDVRARWSVPGDASTNVTDALLTILLAEATTIIAGAANAWGSKYDIALTALTAHLAFESLQAGSTPTAVYGASTSESFVQRSLSRGGGGASLPAEYMRFVTTVPGMTFVQLAMALSKSRFPMVSSG